MRRRLSGWLAAGLPARASLSVCLSVCVPVCVYLSLSVSGLLLLLLSPPPPPPLLGQSKNKLLVGCAPSSRGRLALLSLSGEAGHCGREFLTRLLVSISIHRNSHSYMYIILSKVPCSSQRDREAGSACIVVEDDTGTRGARLARRTRQAASVSQRARPPGARW